MSGSVAWQARPYRSGDDVRLAQLWTDVFGRPMSVEHWRWKLKGRPWAVENVWVAGLPDGRIVGQYAGIPVQLQLGGALGALVDAFVIVDSMTHPDFRHRGVRAALITAAHEAWASAGASFALGLPNESSKTSLVEWTLAFQLPWSRLVLRLDEIVSRPGRLPRRLKPAAASIARLADRARRPAWQRESGTTVEVETVDPVTFAWPDLDELWRALAPAYTNVLVRDSAWWRWRFIDRPDSPYHVLVARDGGRPRGAAVYRFDESEGGRRGVICDLFTSPGDRDTANALLGAALADLWDRGAGTVLTLAPPSGPVDLVLRGLGFRRRPIAFPFMYAPLNARAGRLFSRDARSWHLSGADFDVV